MTYVIGMSGLHDRIVRDLCISMHKKKNIAGQSSNIPKYEQCLMQYLARMHELTLQLKETVNESILDEVFSDMYSYF